jgi:probable metal-binding protein
MDALASHQQPILGHDLLTLLSRMGGRADIEALRNAAAGAFGPDAVYGNCHGDRFSFDEVLAFLEEHGKLGYCGDNVVLGTVSACSGH